MKFMVTYPLDPSSHHERVSRFLETGAPPPDGVTMHGRWHSVAADRGFLLASTDDPKALFRWTGQWSDILEFEVYPVLDDQEAGEVLRELHG